MTKLKYEIHEEEKEPKLELDARKVQRKKLVLHVPLEVYAKLQRYICSMLILCILGMKIFSRTLLVNAP
jgi:hypothetical protein